MLSMKLSSNKLQYKEEKEEKIVEHMLMVTTTVSARNNLITSATKYCVQDFKIVLDLFLLINCVKYALFKTHTKSFKSCKTTITSEEIFFFLKLCDL